MGTTITSGERYVSSGANASAVTVAADGVLYVRGGASATRLTITSGGRVAFQGQDSRGDYVSGRASANGIAISRGGILQVNSKFALTATNVAIYHGAGMEFNVNNHYILNYAVQTLRGTWTADWSSGSHAFTLSDGMLTGFGGQFGTLDSEGNVVGHLSMTVYYGGVVSGADIRGTVDGNKTPNSYIRVNNGGKVVNAHVEGLQLAIVSGGFASGISTTLPGGCEDWAFATEIDVIGANAKADKVTLNGGVMLVYDKAVVTNVTMKAPAGAAPEENAYPPVGLDVENGGVVSNLVASAGLIEVGGGTISRATINSGAEIDFYAWGSNVLTGALTLGGKIVTGGANVNAKNLTVNFDLRGHGGPTTMMIDNLACLKNATLSSITVKSSQANTVYVLADGASAFSGSISVGCVVNGKTQQLGSVKVGGTLTTAYGSYTLSKVASLLRLTIAGNPYGASPDLPAPLPAPSVVCDDPDTPNRSAVTLTATYDEATLIKQWSADGQTWQTYAGDLAITANTTYYFRSIDVYGTPSAVASRQVTNIFTTSWSHGKVAIAKNATFTADLCLTVEMLAKLSGDFGTMNGTVSLTRLDGEGTPVGEAVQGTITKGVLRFNADAWTANRRVLFDGQSMYRLTVTNTTGAAATIVSLAIAGAADNTDDAYDAAGVKTLTLKANAATPQTLLANGWVGFGDDVDYSKFTVAAGGANLVLGLTATDDVTFYLYAAADLAAGKSAPEDAIGTLAVTAADGQKLLDCGQLAAGTYYLKAVTASAPEPEDPGTAPVYRDADYVVKAMSCLQVQDGADLWALAANQTLAKGASRTYGLRVEKASMYAFASQKIGNLTGTVTLTSAAGAVVATGTVAAGNVTFNGGKRVRLDADTVYGITFKNTGAAVANLALNFAAAAGNADDVFSLDPEAGFVPTALNPTKPGQSLLANGWVGLGDAVDYSKFTLANPTVMSLTFSATATTAFSLCDENGDEIDGKSVAIAAVGRAVSATLDCGELAPGTYYVKATTAEADSDYTVKTAGFITILEGERAVAVGANAIAKGGTYTVGLRLTKESMYGLSGAFGTLTGTVTLKTAAGATVATGTVTNGKLVFNGGRRVQVDEGETYFLTFKNTGKAAATIASATFSAAAVNADDLKDAVAVDDAKRLVTAANPAIAPATGWVGLGDAVDWHAFNLATPATMALSYSATGNTEFALCDAEGNAIAGKTVTIRANGTKAAATLSLGEMDAGDYYLRVTATAGGDSDYTVKTTSFVTTNLLADAWQQAGKTTIAKGGSFSVGLRMEKASMYRLSGSFAKMTGTVTLTQGGMTVAAGTVKNGVLAFNGGRRVELAAGTTYVLTLKNAGAAAVAVSGMKFAAAAGNADDTRANRADRGALTKAGAIVAKGAGWVGLGDVDDYSKFTLNSDATTTLTVTATDKTTFALYQVVDAEDPERDLQIGAITVNARGNQVSASLFSGELEAGEYYVVAHSVNAGDSDYTVTASSFVKTTVYERSWSQATTTLAKGASLTVGLNMGTASMYKLTGNFAKNKMNGTVTLTQGGVTIATGTIKNGALTFNGGQKVEIAAGTTYLLTVKNTGTAAATVTNLSFAAAAGNGDDAKETATALAPSKASQALVSAGWVGLGDATDYYKFTLAKDTTMGLTFTATDKTTFELLDADGNAIAGKSVTISTNGVKASATLSLGELAQGNYFVRATSTNAGDSDYTIATNQFVATNDYANAWSLGKTTLAKGASLSYGLRMTKESMYALSGSFAATMNGTVTLTQGGVTVASGTIKAGKLTFNGGQRVEVADGETYVLTVKNTGSAAVTINSMKLAASAVNTDDDFAHSKARGALTKAGQTLVSDWLGLGDDADYSTFTLSKSTDLSLTFTATGNATFQLLDAEGNAIDGKSVSVIANGTAASATLNVGRGVAGTTYYVRATLDGGADCAYTVAANSGTKVYASDNTNDTLNAAAAKSNKLNANAVNSKKAVVGQTVTGWVGFGDAADFIKVAVSKAGKVSLAMNAATAAAVKADKLDVKLFKANGAELALAASGSTLKTTAKLAAGTYYLGVSTALEGPTQYNNNYQVTAKWLAS